MTSVSTGSFIYDTLTYIRDTLTSGITDPISSARTSVDTRAKFVMTSYPERAVLYPIITVRNQGPTDIKRLGMQSELQWVNMPIEIRVWARNEKERDSLSTDVYNVLRGNQFGDVNSSADIKGLHDFNVKSSVPVDEDDVKSQVIAVNYKFILGA